MDAAYKHKWTKIESCCSVILKQTDTVDNITGTKTLTQEPFVSRPEAICESPEAPSLSTEQPKPPRPPPLSPTAAAPAYPSSSLPRENKNKNTPLKSHQSATQITEEKPKLIRANPWFLLRFILQVVGVEPVPLQEAPALPRRRSGARRGRGGCDGETANGGSDGHLLTRVWGGNSREEGGSGESGGRHRRRVARARQRPFLPGRRDQRG